MKVFKIARDEANNRLTYLKVTGGTLKVKSPLSNADHVRFGEEVWEQKVNQIRIYSGTKYELINEADAGMVCAVTGLDHTYPGQGFGIEAQGETPVLEPVLHFRLILPEGVEPAVMLPKLRQIEEEEPELHIVWNEKLQEIQIQIMGEVQTEILKSMIAERFGVDVSFGPGKIVYKETIADTVEGVGHFEPLRHYAEVHLLLEPLEPGSGIVIDTDCSEDVLDKNWQRLIVTHLKEREHIGVLTGSVITDMKITVIGGRAHTLHRDGCTRHGLLSYYSECRRILSPLIPSQTATAIHTISKSAHTTIILLLNTIIFAKRNQHIHSTAHSTVLTFRQ